MKLTKLSCILLLITILLATRTSLGFRAPSQAKSQYNGHRMRIKASKSQDWYSRSLKSVKKRGAAVLVAAGVLIAPRVGNARVAKGALDEIDIYIGNDLLA